MCINILNCNVNQSTNYYAKSLLVCCQIAFFYLKRVKIRQRQRSWWPVNESDSTVSAFTDKTKSSSLWPPPITQPLSRGQQVLREAGALQLGTVTHDWWSVNRLAGTAFMTGLRPLRYAAPSALCSSPRFYLQPVMGDLKFGVRKGADTKQ